MEDYQDKINISSIPEIEIKSLPEYINLICQIARVWRNYIGPIDYVDNETETDDSYHDVREPFPGELIPWFRGNRLSKYNLEPALLRENNTLGMERYLAGMENNGNDKTNVLSVIKSIEGYMMRRFITAGLPHTNVKHQETMQWMMLMQHNGLPTRLLDWTKSSLVALHFAVTKKMDDEENKSKHCSVWMLDPRRLQESHGEGRRKIYTDVDNKVKAYLSLEKDSISSKVPIPVIPSHVHDRIIAQQSRFTLHNHVRNSLHNFGSQVAEESGCPPLVKILIPSEFKDDFGKGLRLMGVSVQEVIPGLDSIAEEIRRRMLLSVKGMY